MILVSLIKKIRARPPTRCRDKIKRIAGNLMQDNDDDDESRKININTGMLLVSLVMGSKLTGLTGLLP